MACGFESRQAHNLYERVLIMNKRKVSVPVFPPFVDILGTPWKIEIHKYDEDSYFKKRRCDGYCSEPDQIVVVCDMTTWPSYDDASSSDEFVANNMKRTLRHEITHAFFTESGLSDSSNDFHDGWAVNEEMVDWIARQGPKLYKAWEEAG